MKTKYLVCGENESQTQGNYNGELSHQQLMLVWEEKQVNNEGCLWLSNEVSTNHGRVRLLLYHVGKKKVISLVFHCILIYNIYKKRVDKIP